MRLDLDFMDTSGYVILPVESPPVPVDATPASGGARPHEKLQITQSLDERQAKEGKLILEVKATARGLVPDLDTILDVQPPGFEIEKTDDQGLSVSKFDPDSEANMVDSDRTWLVHFRALPSRTRRPRLSSSRRPNPTGPRWSTSAMSMPIWSRSGPRSLSRHGTGSRATPGPGGSVACFCSPHWPSGPSSRFVRSRPRRMKTARFQLPEEITAFSVLGLLREIEHQNGLPVAQMQELATSIQQLERHYFAGSNGSEPDLKKIAETWVSRAS